MAEIIIEIGGQKVAFDWTNPAPPTERDVHELTRGFLKSQGADPKALPDYQPPQPTQPQVGSDAFTKAAAKNTSPYKYGGVDPQKGMDCSGATCHFAKQFNVDLPRTAQAQFHDKRGIGVSQANLQPGDLVFFGSPGPSGWHVGIYKANGKFMHQSTDKSPGLSEGDVKKHAAKYGWKGAKRFAGLNPTTQAAATLPGHAQVALGAASRLQATADFTPQPEQPGFLTRAGQAIQKQVEQGQRERRTRDGTIEVAMAAVDQKLEGRINPKQRQAIKDYLYALGGMDGVSATHMQMALKMAGQGHYKYMVDMGQRAKRAGSTLMEALPFTPQALTESFDHGMQIVRTKAGGRISMPEAMRRWQEAGGTPEIGSGRNYLDNPELYRSDFGRIKTQEQNMAEGGRPYRSANKDDKFFRDKGPTADLPARNLAATIKQMTKGIDPEIVDQVIAQEIKTPLVLGSNDVANFFRGGVPGLGQIAWAEDLAPILKIAEKEGIGKASVVYLQSMAQSANLFEQGIRPTERVTRGLGLLLTALGVGAAGRTAYMRGSKVQAAKELAGKLNVSEKTAMSLLLEADGHARVFLKQQEKLLDQGLPIRPRLGTELVGAPPREAIKPPVKITESVPVDKTSVGTLGTKTKGGKPAVPQRSPAKLDRHLVIHAGPEHATKLKEEGFTLVSENQGLWAAEVAPWSQRVLGELGIKPDVKKSKVYSAYHDYPGRYDFPNKYGEINWNRLPKENPLTEYKRPDIDPEAAYQAVVDRNKADKARRTAQPQSAPVTRKSADGRPFTETRLNPNEIGVMPGLQYKKRGIVDATNAVTDDLKNVHVYDQATAGPLTVWQTPDGRHWVINGHHRRELAIRTGEKDVPVRVFKAEHGVTFNDAKFLGAVQNIMDNKHSPLDAATVLKQNGANIENLKKLGINTRQGVARDAIGLTKLADDSFEMVANGEVSEVVAAAIGDAGLTPDRQLLAMKYAKDLETRNQGSLLAERVRKAEKIERVSEADLFGEGAFDDLPFSEIAILEDLVIKRLATNKRALDAINRGKAVGKTIIDAEAQSSASKAEATAKQWIGTLDDVQRALEKEAIEYVRTPTKLRLEQAVERVTDLARRAADARARELTGKPSGPHPAGSGREGTSPIESPATNGSGRPSTQTRPDGHHSPTENPGKLFDEPEDLALSSPDAKSKKPKAKADPTEQPSLPEMGDKAGQLTFGDGESGSLFTPRETPQAPQASQRHKPGRIKPSALPGGFSGKLKDLVIDLGKIAGTKIIEAKRTANGAGGVYWPDSYGVTTRFRGDLSIASHELGHALDDLVGIGQGWDPKAPAPFDAELKWFWERGGSAEAGSPLPYKRGEGIAEYIRGLLVNPDATRIQAPSFTKYFDSKVPPKILTEIQRVGTNIRRYHGMSATSKVSASIVDKPSKLAELWNLRKRPAINDAYYTHWSDSVRKAFTDTYAPVNAAVVEIMRRRGIKSLRASQDPRTLLGTVPYFDNRFNSVLSHGMINRQGDLITGKPRDIFATLDRSSKDALARDVKDLEALLVSERVLEKADHIAIAGQKRYTELVVRATDRMSQRLEAHEAKLRQEQDVNVARQEGSLTAQAKSQGWSPGKLATEIDKARTAADDLVTFQMHGAAAKEQAKLDAYGKRLSGRIMKLVAARQNRLTGVGGRLEASVDVHALALSELKSNPNRHARLSMAAAAYREWADAVLKYMVEKRRLSQTDYDRIKASNTQYAAMQRLVDNLEVRTNKGKVANAKDVLKKFRGSDRDMISPFANLMETTYTVMKETDRNEVMLALRDMLTTNRGMHDGSVADLASIGMKVDAGTPNSLKIFVDGKLEHWMFEEGIHNSLKGIGEVKMDGTLVKILSTPAKVTRWGVTAQIPFQIRNAIRDRLDLLVKTQHGVNPLNLVKRSTAEERRLYDVFSGGLGREKYSDHRHDYGKIRDAMIREMRTDKRNIVLDPREWIKGIKRAEHAYENLLESTERAPRLAEFRRAEATAKANGVTDVYDIRLSQGEASRNLINFAAGGDVTKFLNAFVPFTNASVQGPRSFFNALARNPKAMVPRLILYTGVAEVAYLIYLRSQGKAEVEKYQQRAGYEKDFAWSFSLGDDRTIKIPKPFEQAAIGSVLSRSFDKYVNGNERAFEDWAPTVKKVVLPLDEGVALSGPVAPIGEAVANYDYFRGKTIVMPNEENAALELREYNKYASELGKLFQRGYDIDARKADHLVRGFLAEAGNLLLAGSDLASDKPMKGERLAKTFIGIVGSDPALNARDVQWVLEKAERSRSGQNPLGRLLTEWHEAKDGASKAKAAKELREAGTILRNRAETFAKGKAGKAYWEAVGQVLKGSEFKRPR